MSAWLSTEVPRRVVRPIPVVDVAGRRQLRSASRGLLNYSLLQHVKLWSMRILFRRSLCLELTF